jgi:hypothetical protein
VHQRSPLAAIVAAGSDIGCPADLAGRRSGEPAATGWLPDELVACLAERGIAPPEIVPVDYGEPPRALGRGTVDIMATFLDTTTQQQPTSGIATRSIHVGHEIYASGLVAADRVPGDVVSRMVLAVRAAFEHQQREPELGIEEFCRRFPATSPVRARETWDLLAPFVFTGSSVGSMDDGRWTETLAWLAGVHGLGVPSPSAVWRQP